VGARSRAWSSLASHLAVPICLLALAAPARPADAPSIATEPGAAHPRTIPRGLDIRAASALVVDDSGNTLYSKGTRDIRPIASITKLMTAMVVLDAHLPLDEPITIDESDRDTLRHSRSRLRIDRNPTLPRGEMLAIALMSSDNRAASALGRTAFPDGKPVFVEAMNRKAQSLGMYDTVYADPTGLDGNNRSTAEDLLKLVRAASAYPLIREITSRASMEVQPYGDGAALEYRNTNPLVKSPDWQIELSKTGYVDEAGHCLVMRAGVAGRHLNIVLLDSAGKRTPVGDATRLREWLASGRAEAPPKMRTAVYDCSRSHRSGCWE
jgi:D-alanyl-D-alanine endopeptidase (penicillin-binding protein 7)